MASFQARIDWKKAQKERRINIVVPFHSYPTSFRKFQKKSKKNSKNKKIPLWLHFKPKQVGKGREREKIKIIVSFCSFQTLYKKFKKNTKKI